MKKRYLLPPLCCVLLPFSGQVMAASECYITDGAAGDYHVVIEPTIIQLPASFMGANVVNMNFPTSYTIPLRGGMDCNNSRSNSNQITLGDADPSLMDVYTVPGTGGGLLKTDIDGISYTYMLRCVKGSGCNHSSDVSDVYLNFPASGVATVPSQSGAPWKDADNNWDLFFDVYQTPSYQPRVDQTDGYAKPGKIGIFRMGTAGQPNEITFLVDASSLHFKVMEPTCQWASVNDAYSTTVDLGNFFVSDIDKNIAREIPFTFELTNCLMTKVTVKMSGNYLAGDPTILTQSGGNADGVGVKVYSVKDSYKQMKADGSNSSTTAFSDWSNNSVSLEYAAKLVPTGTAVKAGDFEAAATFTFTYE
ncbi:fimbrial protein [Salmonella enterica subsp. enterica serovar Stanleyville]|nr:hypothetical protein EL006_18960 [Salmonella enterica subsp. enterica serovar Stanleyville]EAM3047570.1 hypothetical protein [Salmonella enterica]EKF5618580.1 fimbrial protein [Salmonella enterica subsp. enterica]AZT65414.1 hypothetical protein ELZ97_18920 [Salmonella enterica subsp. enterica serovar Stanleyville]AZT69591.1 hypothetical protein ELZ68_18930 [Salmonella enterica subsp. enterica serovar Stanleyville]